MNLTILSPRVRTVEAEVHVGHCLLLLVLGGVQPRRVEDREGVDEDRVEGGLLLLRKRQERLPEMERVMFGVTMSKVKIAESVIGTKKRIQSGRNSSKQQSSALMLTLGR